MYLKLVKVIPGEKLICTPWTVSPDVSNHCVLLWCCWSSYEAGWLVLLSPLPKWLPSRHHGWRCTVPGSPKKQNLWFSAKRLMYQCSYCIHSTDHNHAFALQLEFCNKVYVIVHVKIWCKHIQLLSRWGSYFTQQQSHKNFVHIPTRSTYKPQSGLDSCAGCACVWESRENSLCSCLWSAVACCQWWCMSLSDPLQHGNTRQEYWGWRGQTKEHHDIWDIMYSVRNQKWNTYIWSHNYWSICIWLDWNREKNCVYFWNKIIYIYFKSVSLL